MHHIKFHPEALHEIERAQDYYYNQSPLLAKAFQDEIETAVEKIQRTPETWLQFRFNSKRILVKRFPYSLIYRIKENIIQVLAVAHQKRKPFYWKDRKL